MIVYSRPLQKFLTLVFVLILGLSLTMSILKPISGVFASNSVLPHAQGVTPFLYPPYPGAVSENSIFDHHMPTYTIQDRTIVTYTGHQAIGTQGDPNCDGIPPDNNNCVKELGLTQN